MRSADNPTTHYQIQRKNALGGGGMATQVSEPAQQQKMWQNQWLATTMTETKTTPPTSTNNSHCPTIPIQLNTAYNIYSTNN